MYDLGGLDLQNGSLRRRDGGHSRAARFSLDLARCRVVGDLHLLNEVLLRLLAGVVGKLTLRAAWLATHVHCRGALREAPACSC